VKTFRAYAPGSKTPSFTGTFEDVDAACRHVLRWLSAESYSVVNQPPLDEIAAMKDLWWAEFKAFGHTLTYWIVARPSTNDANEEGRGGRRRST
jgi:hypothetical protein